MRTMYFTSTLERFFRRTHILNNPQTQRGNTLKKTVLLAELSSTRKYNPQLAYTIHFLSLVVAWQKMIGSFSLLCGPHCLENRKFVLLNLGRQ